MSYHRFIGGAHDGEWHNVVRDQGLFLPRVWTLAKRPQVELGSSQDSMEPIPTMSTTDYVPMPLYSGEEEVVTFFIKIDMKPEDAMMRLAECYKPSEPEF